MLGLVSNTIKNDHITAVNIMEFVRHFVDQNAILRHQGRLHTWSIDVVLLEQEQPNQHCRANGNHDNENPFPNSPHLRALLLTQISANGLASFCFIGCNQFADFRDFHSFAHDPLTVQRLDRPSMTPQSEAMSFSTRSSRLLSGSLHKTVLCA